MSAAEVIEEIKQLPPEEQLKVVAYIRELGNADGLLTMASHLLLAPVRA